MMSVRSSDVLVGAFDCLSAGEQFSVGRSKSGVGGRRDEEETSIAASADRATAQVY